MMDAWIFTLLIAVIISGLICSAIANTKGASSTGWFFLGLFFGPIAILAIAIKSTEAPPDDLHALRPCPFCAESIRREAIVCRYCGREVEPLPLESSVVSNVSYAIPSLDEKLISAAAAGNEQACLALIKQGANPLTKDSYGYTASDYARGRGHSGVLRLLKSYTPGVSG